MSSKGRLLTFAFVAALGPALLDAQVLQHTGAGALVVGPAVELLDAQPFSTQAVVRGAAFSADAVTEFTQILSDGNRIERRFSATIARDGRGRTRREQEVALLGPLATLQDEPPQLVTISDPDTGMHYTLDTRAKVAHRSRVAMAHVKAELSKVVTRKVFTLGKPVDGQLIAGAFSKKGLTQNVGTEQLGTRQIEGVAAEGTRTTTTIPPGSIGNIGPIAVVTERWFSKELQEAVLITRSDPRSGETAYRLTNIVRAEPPPDLFAVPTDYQVQDPTNVIKKLQLREVTKGGLGGRGVN